MAQLVFQANSGGQTNVNGQNTASTFNLTLPLANGNLVSTGDTATVTNTMLANSSLTIGSTSIALGATSTALNGVNIGASTPGTGAFTTFSASSTATFSGGTANGVAYLNGSKVLTTGSALTFDGTNLGLLGFAAASNFYTPATVFGIGVSDNSATIVGYGGTGSGGTTNTLTFRVAGSEKMRLTSTGLGIGTSSPSATLTVSGSIVSNQTASFGSALDLSVISSSYYLSRFYNGSTAIGNIATNSGGTGIQLSSSNTLNLVSSGGNLLLDTSGNLGLGVTPSAWDSTYKVLQLQSGSGGCVAAQNGGDVELSTNQYIASGGTRYYLQSSKYAGYYAISAYGGVHQWFTAPTGTAGSAISFTAAMTLFNTGGFAVGATSDPGAGNIGITQTKWVGLNPTARYVPDDASVGGALYTSGGFRFFVNSSTEAARFDSNGNFGLGGTSFGSGSLVTFIANATIAPTTNPSGGGILYVQGGALKYRGSSGTVTTIANA